MHRLLVLEFEKQNYFFANGQHILFEICEAFFSFWSIDSLLASVQSYDVNLNVSQPHTGNGEVVFAIYTSLA